MKTPGERLAFFISNKNVDLKEVTNNSDLSYNNFTSVLKGKRSFGIKIINECKKIFPMLNANWVLYGEGDPEIGESDRVNENIAQYGLSKDSDPEKHIIAGLRDFVVKTAKEAVRDDLSELQEDLMILFKRDLETNEKKGRSNSEVG